MKRVNYNAVELWVRLRVISRISFEVRTRQFDFNSMMRARCWQMWSPLLETISGMSTNEWFNTRAAALKNAIPDGHMGESTWAPK